MADILGQPAQFEITFPEVSYDAGTETLDLQVKVDVLADTTGEHNVVVYLLEDDAIEGQEDNRVPGGIVYPYTHNHALRTTSTGRGERRPHRCHHPWTDGHPHLQRLRACPLTYWSPRIARWWRTSTGWTTDEVMQVSERHPDPITALIKHRAFT
ncbi:MAG: hypothetical protein IPG74_19475 [Flavobacteriales bacterium]|nr:hypothetical protein [Flavobacteriales bacterium]